MWLDSLFKAISEIFGFVKQENNPEVIRLNKIASLESDLDKERKKLDELLAKEDSNPIELGMCINRIIILRRKRDNLKK